MLIKEIDTIRSSEITSTIKIQCNYSNNDILYTFEVTPEKKQNYFDDFTKLISKLDDNQKLFFIEPYKFDNSTDSNNQKYSFNYCPGNDLNTFFYKNQDNKRPPNLESYYDYFNEIDHLYLRKWLFSIVCGIQILINNNIKLIRISNRFVFIDSKMESRISYSNWDTETKRSTTPNILFFMPPEDIGLDYDETLNTSSPEEKVSYSIGVLIISLLNKISPNSYFHNTAIRIVSETLGKGGFYNDKIPNCSLKPLIAKCLQEEPNKRPKLREIIEELITSRNGLSEAKYGEYCEWLRRKFDLFGREGKELIEGILQIVNRKVTERDEAEADVKGGGFKIADMPKFLELASGTSFYKEIIDNSDSLLEKLSQLLSDYVKNKFNVNKSKSNKYEMISEYLKCSNLTTGIKLVDLFRGRLNAFSIDNMKGNLSFSILISNQTIRLVLPKTFKIYPDYIENFNDDPLFVEVFDMQTDKSSQPAQINFYPFLNVYNLLHGNKWNRHIEYEDKVRWLLQTSRALTRLHERGFTVEEFSSQDVFIDIDFNAHFFPTKMKRKDSKESLEKDFFLEDEFNYHLAYNAPEVITGQSEGSTSESRIVFSFGVFICELLNEEKPGNFLYNQTPKEKKRLLKKQRTPTFENNSSFEAIVKSCLEIEPKKRRTFSSIAEMIFKISNPTKEKDSNTEKTKNNSHDPAYNFEITHLQLASDCGSSIPDEILKYINKKMSRDEILSFNFYLNKGTDIFTKYELAWIILNHHQNDLNEALKIMRGEKVKFKVYDPLESRYEAAVKSDNFHCENAAESQINETNELFDKKNCSIKYYKYVHLAGLQKRASRQLILRTGRNFIPKVHYEVEVLVKNSYDYPYGVNLKMQNTEKMIDEFYRKGFYPKNTVQGRNKGGNITLNINDTNNVNNQKQSEEK
ncbi:hypothetical protein M9Y10_014934 [Tritrichomonas musculus]|uniref:Protein kinase domain-containing protein n=1 Tax=Tritrichomonas musculus TaxID=1915356 RepID=A0ABR2L2P8_9EUKA